MIFAESTELDSPCVGISITISARGHLGDVVATVSEHLPGLVCHPTVRPVIDDNIVNNILNVRLELLQDPVLRSPALPHHLLQVNVSLQQELGAPLLLSKAGKCFSVSSVDDSIFSNSSFAILKNMFVSWSMIVGDIFNLHLSDMDSWQEEVVLETRCFPASSP